MNQIEKLNELVVDIKFNKNLRYDELLEHEYIDNTLHNAVATFFKKTNFDYEEILNNGRILILYEILDEFVIRDKEYAGASFLSYLSKVLYYRICNGYEDYCIFREHGNYKIVSLEAIGVPVEILDPEHFIDKEFEEQILSKLNFDHMLEVLTLRERQVIEMMFEDELQQNEIADLLGIHYTTVFTYKERAFEKIKEYMSYILEGQ